MSDETCRNCFFWRSRADRNYYTPPGPPVCMRFPPTIPLRGENPEYPQTRDTDWCGEHAEKP